MKRIFLVPLMVFLVGVSLASADQRVVIPLENSPAMGPDRAPVTIIEFIDFQ